MKAINQMKLVFPAKSVNEGFARGAVSAFVAVIDPTVEELIDLRTAVSEAVTNAIVHAYRESAGDITLRCKLYDDRRIQVTVKDVGCGIPDVDKAREPLFTSLPGGERSGLGFTVMESFCDRVKVRSKVGKGTVVTLEKRMSPRG